MPMLSVKRNAALYIKFRLYLIVDYSSRFFRSLVTMLSQTQTTKKTALTNINNIIGDKHKNRIKLVTHADAHYASY